MRPSTSPVSSRTACAPAPVGDRACESCHNVHRSRLRRWSPIPTTPTTGSIRVEAGPRSACGATTAPVRTTTLTATTYVPITHRFDDDRDMTRAPTARAATGRIRLDRHGWPRDPGVQPLPRQARIHRPKLLGVYSPATAMTNIERACRSPATTTRSCAICHFGVVGHASTAATRPATRRTARGRESASGSSTTTRRPTRARSTPPARSLADAPVAWRRLQELPRRARHRQPYDELRGTTCTRGYTPSNVASASTATTARCRRPTTSSGTYPTQPAARRPTARSRAPLRPPDGHRGRRCRPARRCRATTATTRTARRAPTACRS